MQLNARLWSSSSVASGFSTKPSRPPSPASRTSGGALSHGDEIANVYRGNSIAEIEDTAGDVRNLKVGDFLAIGGHMALDPDRGGLLAEVLPR